MRILHVTKKYPPAVGGDATAVAALARTQRRRGHDVHILVYRTIGIEATDHVRPIGPIQSSGGLDRVGFRRLLGMRAMRKWAEKSLRPLAPDLVHAHSVDVGAAVVAAAKSHRIPIILTCHGVWFPHRRQWSPIGWTERSLLRRGYDAITSVDWASVRAIQDKGRVDAVLVPNGVELSEFAGLGLRENPVRFLFVGRHVYQKGIDVLLEAAARARSRMREPFHVELAGDGPERPRAERKANSLGLSTVVRFLGSLPRSDLVLAYGRASVFVLPSRFEGFPLAILEAWAAKLPVIATEVGGVQDFCDAENSLLVPPGDPDALADAMTALAQDSGRREKLGAAGHTLVRQRFTWDAIAEAYERVYAGCRHAPAA